MKRLVLLSCALLGLPVLAFGQGAITPGGAPAPAFKTLQQIEPRVDLQNAPAAAVTTSNSSYHYIINQPGSYYLTANVAATKTHGIQINAAGVVLDLNGFEISRGSGTGGNGIEIVSSGHRAKVVNGSIRGFSYGIRSLFFIVAPRGCLFRDLAVSGCTSYGIYAGEGAVLESCQAHGNSGTAAIHADIGASLTNCTAVSNTGTHGLHTDNNATLTNCAVYLHSGTTGIFAGPASTLLNCSAYGNTATYGIQAEDGSSLTGCAVASNDGQYGIYAGSGSSLINCSASMFDIALLSIFILVQTHRMKIKDADVFCHGLKMGLGAPRASRVGLKSEPPLTVTEWLVSTSRKMILLLRRITITSTHRRWHAY